MATRHDIQRRSTVLHSVRFMKETNTAVEDVAIEQRIGSPGSPKSMELQILVPSSSPHLEPNLIMKADLFEDEVRSCNIAPT